MSVYYVPRRSAWDRLKTGAAAAMASPAGQAAITSLVQFAVTGLVGLTALRSKREQPDQAGKELERLIATIDEKLRQLPDGGTVMVTLAKQRPERPAVGSSSMGTEDESREPEIAFSEASGGREGALSEEGSEAGGEERAPGAQSGPEELSVACVPCARAHLVGVSAELDEATRFLPEAEAMIRRREEEAREALERGEEPPPPLTVMDHPEIGDRVRFAAREIVSLERRDWSPERILRTSPKEREIVMRYRPEVRDLRQQVVNRVRTPDDLMRVAAQANDLWDRFEADSRDAVPPEAPDGERLAEAARAYAASRNGGSAA